MKDAADLLPLLKCDLGIMTDAYNERLVGYIENAQREITREGVVLGDGIDDDSLTVMYAAWTWRRRDSGEGMPRMLRYALNNRIFSQKMGGS